MLCILQDLPCLKSRLVAPDPPCHSLEESDESTAMRPLRRPRQRHQTEMETKEEAANKSSNDYLPDFEPAAPILDKSKVQQTTCHHLPYNFFETKPDSHFEKLL